MSVSSLTTMEDAHPIRSNGHHGPGSAIPIRSNGHHGPGSAIASVIAKTTQTSKYELLKSTQVSPARHPNRYAIACALLASMNSILLGYDIGVISGAVLFIKEDLNLDEVQEEVLVSALNIVSLAGGAMAGRLADALGRRWTMALAAMVFLFGAAGMGLAPSFTFLMCGRLLAGFGVGLALMVAPVYTAEVAPATSRGSLVSLPEIFINIGILLGYVANYAFAGLPTAIGWRVMLGLGILPALCLAIGVIFMPESPRWLVMQNRISEAQVILRRTSADQEEAERRLLDIMEAAGIVRDANTENVDETKVENFLTLDVKMTGRSHGEGVWKELLWPTPPVRKMLVVATGIQFFQQATGIDAIVYYSPEVFKEAGVASKSGVIAATVAMGFTKCLFILIAIMYLDRVGRRPLLLISSVGITCSLAMVAVCFSFFHSQGGVLVILIILAVCSYAAFFSIGMGPVCWVLTTEIFPLRLRAQAMSLAIVINRLASGTVSLTFLSILRAITMVGTYCLFTVIAMFSVLFIYFCVPETKGKSLEEVAKIFSHNDSHSLLAAELGELSVDEEEKHLNAVASMQAPRDWLYDDEVALAGSLNKDEVPSRKELVAKVRAIANNHR